MSWTMLLNGLCPPVVAPVRGCQNLSAGLLTNLVLCYDMDEPSGVRVDNISGRNLSPVDNPGSTVGQVNNAVHLIQAAHQALLANTWANMCQTNFTFTFWFRPTTLTTVGPHMTLFAKATALAVGQYEFICFINYTNQKLTVYFGAGLGGIIEHPLVLTAGLWYFVAITHSTTQLKMSINDGSMQIAGANFGQSGTTLVPSVGSIGGVSNFFDGDIDLFMYWERVLDASEITTIFNL